MFGGRRFLALFLVGASLLGACGDDGDPDPERATVPTAESTTTTTTAATTTTAPPADFEALPADPALTPEEQVEAAYLHSWDIYLDAVQNGRTDYLALVHADDALTTVTNEVNDLIATDQRIEGRVDHSYEISLADDGALAVVIDRYVNHLVYVDPSSREPLEPDPNSERTYQFTIERREDVWYVVGIRRL